MGLNFVQQVEGKEYYGTAKYSLQEFHALDSTQLEYELRKISDFADGFRTGYVEPLAAEESKISVARGWAELGLLFKIVIFGIGLAPTLFTLLLFKFKFITFFVFCAFTVPFCIMPIIKIKKGKKIISESTNNIERITREMNLYIYRDHFDECMQGKVAIPDCFCSPYKMHYLVKVVSTGRATNLKEALLLLDNEERANNLRDSISANVQNIVDSVHNLNVNVSAVNSNVSAVNNNVRNLY